MNGDLTLLGVTKPVTLDVTFNGSGMNPFAKSQTLGFSATGNIKRSQWGMTAWDKAVGDDVKLIIEVEFNQKLEEKK
jgi:polyisoprenoid-binding protein YceI